MEGEGREVSSGALDRCRRRGRRAPHLADDGRDVPRVVPSDDALRAEVLLTDEERVALGVDHQEIEIVRRAIEQPPGEYSTSSMRMSGAPRLNERIGTPAAANVASKVAGSTCR